MEPIRVPAPPAAAFNKGRRISDLIRAQVGHMKHLEDKMSAQARAGLPQHGITTEEDAALYIAAMTHLLRAQPSAPSLAAPTSITSGRRPAGSPQQETLTIAASADSTNGKAAAPAMRKRKK